MLRNFSNKEAFGRFLGSLGHSFFSGVLGVVQPEDGNAVVATMTAGYDAVIGAGVLFASQVDLSPGRIYRVNRAGGLGLLAGGAAGGLLSAVVSDGNNSSVPLSLFSTVTVCWRSHRNYNWFLSNRRLRTKLPEQKSL